MRSLIPVCLFLAGAAHATATPELGTPQEFSARVRAGSVSLETFDFAAAGFWKLPNRYAWVGGLHLLEGGYPSMYTMEACDVAWHRMTIQSPWIDVLIGSRSPEVWAATVATLGARLRTLDLATWDALAATGVTPTSSRAERLRRRYVWAQTLSDPALNAQLRAGLPFSALRYWNGLMQTRIAQVECANTAWLKAQLDEIGWFDIPRFGNAADAQAWALLDRTGRDPAIARRAFHSLEAMPPGSTNPTKLAYLFDRVALEEHGGQRYGTLGFCWQRGGWSLEKLEDPGTVDKWRASVGLGPLADFVRESKAHCQEIMQPSYFMKRRD